MNNTRKPKHWARKEINHEAWQMRRTVTLWGFVVLPMVIAAGLVWYFVR